MPITPSTAEKSVLSNKEWPQSNENKKNMACQW